MKPSGSNSTAVDIRLKGKMHRFCSTVVDIMDVNNNTNTSFDVTLSYIMSL